MTTKRKKKPASSNLAARGFSTVSLPSKSALAALAAENETDNLDNNFTKDGPFPFNTNEENGTAAPLPEASPKHMEENDLQYIIDNQSQKVSKDYQRQITRITTDCRLRVLPNQSSLETGQWLSQDLVDELLNLSRKQSRPEPKREDNDQLLVSKDDWIVRFWTLYKVLSDMGVSSHRILDLLGKLPLTETNPKSVHIWGLEHSLDILALDDETELPPYVPKHNHHNNITIEPAPAAIPATVPVTVSRSAAAAAVVSKASSATSTSQTNTPLILTPQILPLQLEDDIEVSDLDCDAEPDQLIDTYVSAKSTLFKIDPSLLPADSSSKSRKKLDKPPSIPTVNSPGITKLQNKIKQIESDFLFDIDQATQKWIQTRLDLSQEKSLEKSLQKLKRPVSKKVDPAEEQNDKSKQEVESDLGSEPMPLELEKLLSNGHQYSSQSESTSITLHDFGKIIGVTPKRVLEDYCRSRDAQCIIQYRLISENPSFCRHSVSISWSKAQHPIEQEEESPTPNVLIQQQLSAVNAKRVSKFTLTNNSLATPKVEQSESYVATIALFCLTCASQDKGYLKLGQSWRDLWSELQQTRTERRHAADRTQLKIFQQIIEQRLDDGDEDVILLTGTSRLELNARHQQAVQKQQLAQSLESAAALNDVSVRRQLGSIDQHNWYNRVQQPSYIGMRHYRDQLPIAKFRQQALEMINANPVTILVGETGCGKSTQLPSFILEQSFQQGQYCKVLCTEPRRISAISLAQRVSEELGEGPGQAGSNLSLVGYAVRLESKMSMQTRLVYATVGVVLRMLESPNGLAEYTHLVIDEVHERSIETDFLLIILKDLLKRRLDLRVILMSATVDAEKFSVYLNNAPMMTIPGRTFKVTSYFLEDAIEQTGYSNEEQVDGHQPSLDIQDDGDTGAAITPATDVSGLSANFAAYSASTRKTLTSYDEYQIDYQLILKIIEMVFSNPDFLPFSQAILIFLPGIGEIRELNNLISTYHASDNLIICPLHSSISSEEQQRAFLIPPPGMRKIVISTNIAETGVTIPDVTCVIDTGKHKEMRFDERRQMSRLAPSFISRANAKQRRGRAGRVQEGICFHLFTKKRHDELMSAQQTPEMLRLSLQDLIMRVKICNLGEIEPTLALGMDPPASRNVRRAIDSLIEVGALTTREELTPLGRQLSKLPLDTNLGKLCILSAIFGCLEAGLTIAAILSSKSPFVVPFGARAQADAARMAFFRGDSDLLTAYNAYRGWKKAFESQGQGVFSYCRKHFLNHQGLSNIEELKGQLFSSLCETGLCSKSDGVYSGQQRRFLKIVGSAASSNNASGTLTNSVIAWSFYPKLLLREGKGWRSVANSRILSLSPTSVNRGSSKPAYLSYYSIMQSTSRTYGSVTNAHYTSIAYELPLILLAGEAEFKMHAGIITLDSNRLRFFAKDWKMMATLKAFRLQLEELVKHATLYPGSKISTDLQQVKNMFETMCRAVDKEMK